MRPSPSSKFIFVIVLLTLVSIIVSAQRVSQDEPPIPLPMATDSQGNSINPVVDSSPRNLIDLLSPIGETVNDIPTFVWTTTSNATKYIVIVKGTNYKEKFTLAAVNCSDVCQLQPTFKGAVPNNTTLKWKVTAKDANNEIVFVTPAAKFNTAIPGPASLITPANNTTIGAQNYGLKWTTVPNATKYKIVVKYKKANANDTFTYKYTKVLTSTELASTCNNITPNVCEFAPPDGTFTPKNKSKYVWFITSFRTIAGIQYATKSVKSSFFYKRGYTLPTATATATLTPTLTPDYIQTSTAEAQQTATAEAQQTATSVAATATATASVPIADFTFVVDGYNVAFTDVSGNSPTSWLWEFTEYTSYGPPSITTSTEQNPSHYFSAPPAYNASVKLTVSNQFGSTSITKIVQVGPKPTAFIATVSVDGLSVSISAAGNATSWFWEFGDGNTGSGKSTSHTYAIAGSYTIKLIASNQYGSVSIERGITVGPKPEPDFTFVVDGFNVAFTDVSGNSPTSWLWEFTEYTSYGPPSITTSTEQNPSHYFSAPPAYNASVKLTVSNQFGSASITKTVQVGPKPTAFIATVNVDGFSVSISAAGNATSWLWEFGDGSTGSGKSTSHTYATAGLYTIRLIASNQYGSVSIEREIAVEIPVADFTFVVDGFNVAFTDTSSNSPTSWLWEFTEYGGVIATSTEQNPSNYFDSPEAGTFPVTLTVTNSFGSTTVTQNVTVGPKPIANFVSGGYELEASFRDLSSNATSWLWEFGDGSTSTQQHPTHIYSAPGTYTVKLTVSNSYGSDSATLSRSVAFIPVASFTYQQNLGTVTFTDTSTNTPYDYHWEFGDATWSYAKNPIHTYGRDGTYTVTLKVYNAAGSSTTTQVISVATEAPVANFTYVATDRTIQFTDTSTGNPTERLWILGTETSTEPNPSITLPNDGFFPVQLIVTNVSGTSTTSTFWVPVFKIAPSLTVSGCFLSYQIVASASLSMPVDWNFEWVVTGIEGGTSFHWKRYPNTTSFSYTSPKCIVGNDTITATITATKTTDKGTSTSIWTGTVRSG